MIAKRSILQAFLCLGALSAVSLLAGCAPASLASGAAVNPGVISPNGDGVDDQADFSYAVSRDSLLNITLLDSAGKAYAFRKNEQRPAGRYAAIFNGTYAPDPASPQRLVMPDGEYTVVLEAIPANKDRGWQPQGAPVEWRGKLTIQGGDAQAPVVGDVVSTYSSITPNGDADQDETQISYSLSKKATVTITAVDKAGTSYLLSAPTERSAALFSHDWNGTSTGNLLPDGPYTIHIRAQDLAGNISEGTAQVSIERSGVPKLEITKVIFTPPAVAKGGVLQVEIRVRNSGKVPLRTIGPAPGTAYDTDINYNYWRDSDGQPIYFERAGVWRVGVEWSVAGRSYPARWGLSKDICGKDFCDLQPGQEAVITGSIKVNIDQTRDVYFWASVVQEGVGFPGGRVGQQRIVVSY